MTSDSIPSCVCTAHPAGDDRKKYMVVAEETRDHVVFCCRRCSEITGTAVIQVRTLKHGKDAARYRVAEQRREITPKLRAMLEARKRGRVKYEEAENDRA